MLMCLIYHIIIHVCCCSLCVFFFFYFPLRGCHVMSYRDYYLSYTRPVLCCVDLNDGRIASPSFTRECRILSCNLFYLFFPSILSFLLLYHFFSSIFSFLLLYLSFLCCIFLSSFLFFRCMSSFLLLYV